MGVRPGFADPGLARRGQHVVDAKGAGADELFHIPGVLEHIKVNNSGGVNLEVVPPQIGLLPVALAVDLLLELVAQGVNAGGQPPGHGVLGAGHIPKQQHWWNLEGPGRKVEDVVRQGADVPGGAAGSHTIGGRWELGVVVAVELRQQGAVRFEKRLDLLVEHIGKPLVELRVVLLRLGDVHLQVLAAAPAVIFHRQGEHPVERAGHGLQHGLHIHGVELEVEHLILPKGLLIGDLPHHHVLILVHLGGVAAGLGEGVRHHQHLLPGTVFGGDHQGLVVGIELVHQLVQKRRAVLVYVGLHIPQVVLVLPDGPPGPEGFELTLAHGVGDGVHAHVEGQLPQAVFLHRLPQLHAFQVRAVFQGRGGEL